MDQVGPYEVLEQLGRGGMGGVFRARDPRTGQEVALKLLNVPDARARRRLLLEARALARLRHRHIVGLLEAGEDRGRPWIALELVRGRSLQQRLDREGPLPPREAARLVRAVAEALAHAHREGVLHRDVKPANVLLPDGGGEPRLADFGLAGFTFDLSQSRLTATGALMGTPGYWAPEQAAGKTDAVGPATDVYGLGALLHAALSGQPPVDAPSLPELLRLTIEGDLRPSGRDRALDAIAARCMARAPDARYPSAEAVARELARYLAGRAPRRRRWRVVAAAAGAVALALLAGALAVRSPANAPAVEPAVEPREAASLAAGDEAPPSAPGPGALPEEALALLARAALRQERDPRGALADYDRALELVPGDAQALAIRGALKERLDDLEGALADLDQALALDPGLVAALLNRGRLRMRKDEPRLALADYDRALAAAPGLGEALVERGVARLHLGDGAGALADLDLAVALAPDDPATRYSRALTRVKVGDDAGALADLDHTIARAPTARALVERAIVRGRGGDAAGALADLDRALVLEPDNARALAARGVERIDLRDLDGAMRDLDRAAALSPGDARILVNRALVRQAKGDLAGAVADFEAAVRLGGDAPWVPQVRASLAQARAALDQAR